jgi:nucleotide-binding universal stress UspA family protein
VFKHILLPTDGSPVSSKAVKRGIEFAKKIGARVTALHVVTTFRFMADEGAMVLNPALRKRFEDEGNARAKEILDAVAKQARAKGVRCATVRVSGDQSFHEIVATARRSKCDLIMMASHGRRGISSILLGSVTSKVLLHSKVPVLVVR